MTFQSDTNAVPAQARLSGATGPAFAYLDWAAIIAGAFVATATSMLLLTFGSALGLSMVSAELGEGASLRWLTIAAGLWFIWVVVSSIGLGSYLAGRLRHPIGDAVSDEVELRDGAQGLVVWALAVVLGSMLAVSGVAGLTSAAIQGTANIGGGIADMVEAPLNIIATTLVRDPTGSAGVSPAVVDDVSAIIMRSLSEGEISATDRSYLVARIAAETGQTPADVLIRLDEAQATAQAVWDDAQDAVETARRAAIITAFAIAATFLAAAAVGYFAAVTGGKHRYDNIPVRTLRR